jgi:putative MATE family efflux protein
MPQVTSLTEGPVARTLVRLTLPMLMAMFAMVGFNIVDTFYVGQLGTEQLAAMGFTLAVVMAVQSISMGIGMGTTAVVSRVIGQGDTHGMQRLIMDAILLGILTALTMSILGLSSIKVVFGLMGADGIVLEYVRDYMTIWFLGLPMIIVPQVGNSGIRATGDTKTPAKIMVTVLTVNAILDPLFIFGWGPVPGFGLQGAAIATVISQAVAFTISFRILRGRGLITFERQTIEGLLASWRRILKISVPAGLTQMITPISTAVITAIVA